jgi:hypothetical protein
MVVCACNPRYSGGISRRIQSLRIAQAKLVRLSKTKLINKKRYMEKSIM